MTVSGKPSSSGWRCNPRQWRLAQGALVPFQIGKRGGTRVIYYNTLPEGQMWLRVAYTKAKFDNLPTAFLKQLKEAISNGERA